ncbi:MAG: glucoamylase family protein, partial [Anaerolineae bacterium]
MSWEGLLDTLSLFDDVARDLPADTLAPFQATLAHMRQQIDAARSDPEAWLPLLSQLLGERWSALNQALVTLIAANAGALTADALNQLRLAADRTQHHLYTLQREIEQLTPWLALLAQAPAIIRQPDGPPALQAAWQALRAGFPVAPALDEIAGICTTGLENLQSLRDQTGVDPQTREWCARLAQALSSAELAANELLVGFQDLELQAAQHVQTMDFRFVFDEQRELFHIGYNVTAEKLDSNYYDLLASEARIASLVTIARNEVPPSHWLRLGRPLTQVDGTRALLSWGGTMFEYLMPALLMRNYDGTLLQRSCLAAVDGQIAYGKHKHVPWGISESGYYAFDGDQNYQYRTFGVPGLGFRRNLTDDLVVAPYASLLALSLRPRQVMENIARLDELHMLGMHGFYESLDFSVQRLPVGTTHAIVRSYMAHHQGMILLSLVNYLHDNTMVRRFHADPVVRSVELLLQEKIPHDAPIEIVQAEDERAAREDPIRQQVYAAPWSVPAQSPAPQVHFLSNGHYGVLITNAGAGFSNWQDLDLTRWRADTTREDCGTWIYVQDRESGALWSAATQPTGARPESQAIQFYPHMAEFRRHDHGIGLTMEITVAPEDDVEIRRISLTNHTERIRRVTLTSYGEVILTPQAADLRHPAFGNLFVESEYVPDTNTLLFRRRPRSASEARIYLAHSATVSQGHPITGANETDRARFLGRGQSLRTPAALSAGGRLSATTGATLDPIMALGQDLELQPHASAQVSFVTAVARTRDQALSLAQRYRDALTIDRAFEQARGQAESELTQLDLTVADLEQIEQLLSALIYPRASMRASAATLAANRKGQASLW